jgi:Protein of unknown function (DUF2795)
MDTHEPGLVTSVRYKLRARFEIDPRLRRPLSLLGVSEPRSGLELDRTALRVRFGPWLVTTAVDNIADAEVTGPYRAWKAIGPRLSLADRGLTFGTNTAEGLCIAFHVPVRGIEPSGLLRHPTLTVTVAEPGLLAGLLRRIATGSAKPRSHEERRTMESMSGRNHWTSYLVDVEYPCQRDVLMRKAAAQGADDDTLGRIGKLPEQQYDDLDAVRTALGR